MSEELKTEVMVLIHWLKSFLPADESDKDAILKSSQDIQDDLSEMVEISVTDISTEMLACGYHIVVDADDKPKWAMMRN